MKTINIEKSSTKRPKEVHTEISSAIVPPLARWDYRLVSRDEMVFVFERHYRPAWVYLVAVLLFPVGLIALLHQLTSVLTVTISEQPEGSAVHFSGDVDSRIAQAVESATL